MEPVEVPCGADAGYQIDAAAIAALDPAPDVVILASPANPTGTVIADDELASASPRSAAEARQSR